MMIATIAVIGVVLFVGVGCSKPGCQNAAGTPGFCYCPASESCAHRCTTESICDLDCAQGNADCSVSCDDSCSALCQGADNCNVTCGQNCLVACQGIKNQCVATVGEGADVRCELAHLCDITCTGACHVDCPGGSCRVKCLDPSRCTLGCEAKGSAPPATLCPDQMTLVCGGAAC